jgi:hypothetical protein
VEIVRFDTDSLFRACRVLFGAEVLLNRQFLEYIQESGIKSAFRSSALANHPDRISHLPSCEQEARKEAFIAAHNAYKELINFVRLRDNSEIELVDTNSRPVEDSKNYNLFRFYKGPIPKRQLLFAEFLYYTGNVPWKAFIDSIVWQRRLRPRFGEIAKSWNYIDEKQIRELVRNKALGEKIGETAVRLEVLTNLQVKTIVLHQRMRQKKIGEYFVLEGILAKSHINDLCYEQRRHNARFIAKRVY